MSIVVQSVELPSSHETGKLGVLHLKRYYYKAIARKVGALRQDSLGEEWNEDIALLSVLGLGLEQTLQYVYRESKGFDEFEDWILSVTEGQLQQHKIDQFNAQLMGERASVSEAPLQVLSAEDLAMWDEQGYIIVRGAVPREDCEAAVDLICNNIGVDLRDPSTWYMPSALKQGIMVQLFQHDLLQKNRSAEKIRLAYEQLWGRKDIYLNTDRVGFNPPETAHYKFPGPHLHWDVSIVQPIPFGTQGILYLTDTLANQGALTVVPGFQNRIGEWLQSLPPGTNPRQQDMYALGAKPIAASAGDFIIWHQALPHGSSPNTAHLPRIVQYVNYNPIDPGMAREWL